MGGTQVPRRTLLGVGWGTSDHTGGERLKTRGAGKIFQGSATMEGLERTAQTKKPHNLPLAKNQKA